MKRNKVSFEKHGHAAYPCSAAHPDAETPEGGSINIRYPRPLQSATGHSKPGSSVGQGNKSGFHKLAREADFQGGGVCEVSTALRQVVGARVSCVRDRFIIRSIITDACQQG